MKIVSGEEDLMLITVDGVLIRIPVEGIPITGRSTQGVRLIRVIGDEEVATVAKIMKEDEEESEATDEQDDSEQDENDSDHDNVD